MRIMDRYLFMNFLVAWVICFVSLVGLYVIIDLFSNADELIEDGGGTIVFLRRAGLYYGVHVFEYFGRLSPVITMVAAMTTLANLHRHNEIVALLAAGVPTKRALAPVLVGVAAVVALGVANREVVIPHFSPILQRRHEDVEGERVLRPTMQIDKDQVLFQAVHAHRRERKLENVNLTFPVAVAGSLQEVHCPEAYHRVDPASGKAGWALVDPDPPIDPAQGGGKIRRLDSGELFVESNVTFEDMIRRPLWKNFAGTVELVRLLQREEVKDPEDVRILVHVRLMDPVMHVLLVMLGVPFVLQWERKNVYAGIAVAMVLCCALFVAVSVAGYVASYGYIDATFAAWAPVLVFGPAATALFYRIGT
jgi:lipopolysaccharide export system permease protein